MADYLVLIKRLKRFCLHAVNSSGLYHSGHFYNPVPSTADINLYPRNSDMDFILANINVNYVFQDHLFSEMIREYPRISLPESLTQGTRYYCNNSYYSHMDGYTLSMMLRILNPERIVEIGSGFSSAVMLDTVEFDPEYNPKLTFIEPHPERLLSLIGNNPNQYSASIVQSAVQDVDLELFTQLRENDILVIDSSHVVKYGSDLSFIFFEILPRLSPGSIVHFHDIWETFEYPLKWLKEGTYWNESYFLRAFLMYNNNWEVIYMTDYMSRIHNSTYVQEMPKCLSGAGSSLYIRRVL